MSRIIINFVLLLFSILPTMAQKVYDTHNESRANLKVYVVKNESRADLIVYITDVASRARQMDNKGVWFLENVESRAEKNLLCQH